MSHFYLHDYRSDRLDSQVNINITQYYISGENVIKQSVLGQ